MKRVETKDNPERRLALADIHRIKNTRGISDENWRLMLTSYGVESSADLPLGQLRLFRRRLHEMFADEVHCDERAKWLKRVYGVVGKWLRDNGWKDDSEAIRTVICRAARKKALRSIELSHLKQIYYAWKAKSEQVEAASLVKRSMEITSLN